MKANIFKRLFKASMDSISFKEKRSYQKELTSLFDELKGKLSFKEKREKQKRVGEIFSILNGANEKKESDDALKKIAFMRKYMPSDEINTLVETKQFDLISDMYKAVTTMPKTYEQDGKGDEAIVYLHYFNGGSDWYITENDKEMPPKQAFGYVVLNGDTQNAELGYISITELVQNGVELDLHFEPKTLKEIKGSDKDIEPSEPYQKNKIIEQAKEVLAKGKDLTIEDLDFFTDDVCNEIDKEIIAENKEAIEFDKSLENTINLFKQLDSIDFDGVEFDSTSKKVKMSIALMKDKYGNFILGERKDSGKYTFVGGHIEDGETPEQALIRETREESGLQLSLGEYEFLSKLSDDIVDIYLFGVKVNDVSSLRSDLDVDGEFSQFNMYSLDELKDIDLHIDYDKNLVVKYLNDEYTEKDGVREKNLGSMIENLFTNPSVSDAKREKALNGIKKLIKTDKTIEKMFTDIVEKLEDENSDLNSKGLFDAIKK